MVIVKPALIEAAQPAILDPAVAQIGAAMWAVESDEARATAIVAEQDEFLAEIGRTARPVLRPTCAFRCCRCL